MTRTAVLGGGCFWCIEAAFKEVGGVKEVISGYAGGSKDNPSYREVCTGRTGHAEVVKLEYEESRISFKDILEIFFRIHDPTQKNRQGPDVGTQYRSIILYQDRKQKEKAKEFIESIDEEYNEEIETEIRPLEKFYRAEEKHQDYFEKNPEDSYCKAHAKPKIEKAGQK